MCHQYAYFFSNSEIAYCVQICAPKSAGHDILRLALWFLASFLLYDIIPRIQTPMCVCSLLFVI
jgi:hypothetical protein